MTLDIYSHVTPGLQQAAAESFEKLINRKNNANLTPFSHIMSN
jgi:hypothetical protein